HRVDIVIFDDPVVIRSAIGKTEFSSLLLGVEPRSRYESCQSRALDLCQVGQQMRGRIVARSSETDRQPVQRDGWACAGYGQHLRLYLVQIILQQYADVWFGARRNEAVGLKSRVESKPMSCK